MSLQEGFKPFENNGLVKPEQIIDLSHMPSQAEIILLWGQRRGYDSTMKRSDIAKLWIREGLAEAYSKYISNPDETKTLNLNDANEMGTFWSKIEPKAH